MNDTITISKSKFDRIQRQARVYRKLAARIFESALNGTIEEVVDDFRNTDLYTEEFLNDLGAGLKKSSYAKR